MSIRIAETKSSFQFIFLQILFQKRCIIACFLLLLLFFPYLSEAQEGSEYDEVSILLQVQNMGSQEIPAVVRDQQVLLPLKEMFDFLQIKASLAQNRDSVSGFFATTQAPYLIDYPKNSITYQGRTFKLDKGDLIQTETNLYLLSKYFGEVFGLYCQFSLRTLSVQLTTKIELPIMRELRLEQMRKNMSSIKGEVRADTIIPAARTLFHLGMVDWSVISTQNIKQKTDTRLNLAIGSVIAGGEANVMLNYNTNEKFTEKQQQYYLRFVNNNRSYLRQAILGKIATDAIASIYNPVLGIRLTNAPTTFRRSFGTYPLSDYTNPNWTVELYVNSVLVDYKKADASGFFTFQVPLVYGNSVVKLKFYGPWGEEREKEQTISIPFNFMQPKKLEYTFGAGLVEDGKGSVFSRGALIYGLNSRITVGTGVEYLSSVTTGNVMPFVTMAARPIPSMTLSGEYSYGVRGRGILTYQFPRNIQLEVNYTMYKPGQKAVNYSYLEERRVILSVPLRSKSLSLYNRLTYNNIILPGTQYTTAEWLISGTVRNINTNLTNYAMFSQSGKPYTYSNLSMSFNLPRGYTLIPQTQYEHSSGEFISAKVALEKYLFNNGYFSISYENNIRSKMQITQFSLRYDLPFAQTGFTARHSKDENTLMEVARGSLIVDTKNHYLGAHNRVSVGKGGIVFSPYLDVNGNKRRDRGEPRVYGLNILINGGRATENDRDTTVRVSELEPYTSYYIELDANSFDNVAWRIRNKTMSIMVDPNQFKLVEIPVSVVGELSGMVYKKSAGKTEGIARVMVNIYNTARQNVARTMTEPDGYYSYLGLSPGKYFARVDTLQLNRLNLISTPDTLQFTILPSRDGDIVEGKNFTLKSTVPEIVAPEVAKTDTLGAPAVPVKAPDTLTVDTKAAKMIFLQVGVFRSRDNVQRLVQRISALVKCPVMVNAERGLIQVCLGGFETPSEAQACKEAIIESGIATRDQLLTISSEKIFGGRAKAPETVKTTDTTRIVSQPQRTKPEPVTADQKYYYVQVGAFKDQKNATRLTQKLASRIPFHIGIVYRDQWFKVRFGGLKNQAELYECIRLIEENGIAKKNELIIDFEQEIPGQTSTIKTTHEIEYVIQVGVFKDKENALQFYQKMTPEAPYPIFLAEKNGLYTVYFGSFTTLTEIKNCRDTLEKKGIKSFLKTE